MLLAGPPGSGKTAIAAHLASSAGVGYVKLVSCEQMAGADGAERLSRITQAFEGAHRARHGIVLLDDLERLLSWSPIGPSFDNTILQALYVLIKKRPPRGRRTLVIGTTSDEVAVRALCLPAFFDATLTVPLLNRAEAEVVLRETDAFSRSADAEAAASAIPQSGIGVKRLLNLVDLAHEGGPHASLDCFLECLTTGAGTYADSGPEEPVQET